MTQREVFSVIIKALIAHFPHAHRHLFLACFEPACKKKDCHSCYLQRPQISAWEVSRVLPKVEDKFNKKCTISPPELFQVIKFYADS